MIPKFHWQFAGIVILSASLAGCSSNSVRLPQSSQCEPGPFPTAVTQIEAPFAETCHFDQLIGDGDPRDVLDSSRLEYWDLSLQDAIHQALAHSKVMQDLGGTVLRAPDTISTAYDPAIHETSPLLGVEAALSAFDAEFSARALCEKNDRRFNNQFLGQRGFFDQDSDRVQAEIAKRTVTGSQFAVRHIIEYDRNNNIGNEFPNGAWDTFLEGELRHSLLRGGGTDFNRIAGPGGRPGIYNGVLIARLRTDISLTEFEIGIRDLLCNVENAYWDLYFAYRDLDTKIQSRDAALETWRQVQTLSETGLKGGEAEKEAQAREQYYRFEEEVQNALMGRLIEGTRTNNGSKPGTFRANPGVYVSERKLRLLLGLPPHDRQLLRPSDEPPVSPVEFEWSCVATEALVRRVELRRQRWQVKSRELELAASKNFLLPTLDLVGRYRWRGFGDDLIGPGDGPRFDNAYADLTSGDFQEWQLGAEFSIPIGLRQAQAGVRNAQLHLARAKCVLLEQERQVVNDLSAALAERNRAFAVLRTDVNRVEAARQQLQSIRVAYENGKVDFYILLDAQRRYTEAEIRYFQSRVEYGLAVRNVYFEKGDLLDYCCVALAEGSWPDEAYRDAMKLERRRARPASLDYRLHPPPVIASGQPLLRPQTSPEAVPAPEPTLANPPSESGADSTPMVEPNAIEPLLQDDRPLAPDPTLPQTELLEKMGFSQQVSAQTVAPADSPLLRRLPALEITNRPKKSQDGVP